VRGIRQPARHESARSRPEGWFQPIDSRSPSLGEQADVCAKAFHDDVETPARFHFRRVDVGAQRIERHLRPIIP
jgi:hypothetical protein